MSPASNNNVFGFSFLIFSTSVARLGTPPLLAYFEWLLGKGSI